MAFVTHHHPRIHGREADHNGADSPLNWHALVVIGFCLAFWAAAAGVLLKLL